jgi:hypothetical protein
VSPSAPPATANPIERAADLIRDVGVAAQQARRYRAVAATVAEPAFERTLAIGTAIRQALRDPERQRVVALDAVGELETLCEACRRAIADVERSAVYRDAVAAVAAGDVERVARLAPTVFTEVEPYPEAIRLYWPVSIAGARRVSHFLPPGDCAARIGLYANDGLPAASPPPEAGADERIPAVVMGAEPDTSESPLALVVEATLLPAPLCRLAGSTTALYYAARVRVPFRVRAAAAVSDEWWTVRPDAYRAYVDELAAALAAHGLTIESEDPSPAV